jgi:hypothetical protein
MGGVCGIFLVMGGQLAYQTHQHVESWETSWCLLLLCEEGCRGTDHYQLTTKSEGQKIGKNITHGIKLDFTLEEEVLLLALRIECPSPPNTY